MLEERLKRYDELISACPQFERQGKTMPYTSANGHMFSQLNKAGEIGIRFSKEVQDQYMEELKTTFFKSYGSIMKGYVLIPDEVVKNTDFMIRLLNESYDYVMSLEPK